MTISARGIIHFVDEEAYFISLEEWEREFRLYTELKKIKFFKNYNKWKNFTLWRKLRRRTQFKKRRQFLEANMFLIDEKLSRPLLLIRDYCCLIKNEMNIVDMSLKDPLDMDEFKDHQNKHVVKQGAHIDLVVNEKIKELLETSCQESLNAFKEENRIRNKDTDEVDEDNQSPPLLVGDESNKEMPYTQEATIRTHYKRLKKFIRLVDYLVLDSKLSMMNNSMVKMSEYLEGNRDVVKFEYKNNGGFPTLINVRPDFINEEIHYIPSFLEIRKIFDEIIVLGVNHICGEHKMLLNNPEFSTYVNVGDTSDEADEYNVDIYSLITQHEIYKFYKASVIRELEVIFSFILKKSNDLEEVLDIVKRASRFSRNNLIDKERADIYSYIQNFIEDDEIIKRLIEKIDIGLFCFDREDLKTNIYHIAVDCLQLIEDQMPGILEERCEKFTEKMQEFNELMSQPAIEVSQFIRHMDNYQMCREQTDEMNKEYAILLGLRALFNNDIYRIKVPGSTSTSMKKMTESRDKVRKLLDEIEGRMNSEINRAKKELAVMVPALEDRLHMLKISTKKLELNNENHRPHAILERLMPNINLAAELVDTSKEYNHYQDKLQIVQTDVTKFEEFKTEINCYLKFWTMRLEWQDHLDDWMETPVSQIQGKELTEVIKKNINLSNVLLKEIDGNFMFQNFKKVIDNFKNIVIIINAFQDKAMKEREWTKIAELLSKDPEIEYYRFDYRDPEFMVISIMEMNMIKYTEEIQEISIRASKEQKLLEMLEDIREFLKGKKSEIVTDLYKNSKDIWILGNNDNLIKLLDDKIVTVTNILSSRYVHGIKPQVVEQKDSLDYFQELLDELGLCQRMWLYLEPIFNGEDSNRELMKERKQFKKSVHTQFIKYLKECHDNPKIFKKRIKRKDKNFLESIREMNRELEVLEKNLINYLEKKRLGFPRFFFVSNDDLIDILSNGKTLAKLQPHLGKLFDSIKRLKTSESMIGAMISPQGELVPFKPTINIGLTEGVNEILKKLEDNMTETVEKMIKVAFREIKEAPEKRIEWIFKHPAQAILTCDSILWTLNTESCFDYDDPWDELEQWFNTLREDLNEVVDKVRGDLPYDKRKMINSLITQDVHYQHIVKELYSEDISSLEDFNWQKQLRFYMDVSEVICRQANSEIHYGYEYLGVPSKLAITPLTDRCWLTITSAIYINLGCAPKGPAGTGKTESTKDLAKNLGTLCIVYNCSEQVTVQMMQGQFLGMIYTGAWLCLDEFNRINIEVLSVIAQQILAMKNALSVDASNFMFDGMAVKSDKFKYLGVFTTMNAVQKRVVYQQKSEHRMNVNSKRA